MLAFDIYRGWDMNNNNNQSPGQNPSWNNYNWNHMALPTFGFIFAVPEPPPDLHIPTQQEIPFHNPPPSTQPSPRIEDITDASTQSQLV
jgi:hypothetical protein